MTKVSVFIESKTGEVLGEVFSFNDRISIGSGHGCSLSLKNMNLAELENEIYFLNGECWLQVGKDGAPVTFMGKQHRSIKISQSSQFQFRDVVLKVIFDSIPEFESEATKIVNETLFETSDKTQIVSQIKPTVEVTSAPPNMEDVEATKVFCDSEKTKILSAQEVKRVLMVTESVEPFQDESTLTNTKFQTSKSRRDYEIKAVKKNIYSQIQAFLSRQDFSRLKVTAKELLNQIQIKERIFPVLGVICLAIAGIMFFARENTVSSTEILPNNELKTDKSPATVKSASASNASANSEVLTSQTKDGYLNEMSRLFE